MIIVGNDCEKCKYCTIEEESKARVYVYCEAREKKYIYGQCIPCDDREEIENAKRD